MLSWLYITEEGARLNRQGGHYIIKRENEIICEVPEGLVEGVVLIDQVQVSSSVIVDCLRRNLPVTWLSTTGRFYGRLTSTQNQDVLRQAEQFALAEEDKFRLELAKRIVFGKIYNQMTVLRRYNRTAKSTTIDEALQYMRAIADKLHMAESIESIRGYEGAIARRYFAELGSMLPDDFSFARRSRRPPLDRFNSLLSFGYTLLLYDFYTAIVNTGLHPYVGFLHSLRNGHPALASDLMEPWRPAIVDSMCLSLISHHELHAEHFIEDEMTGGIYLDRIGRRVFICAYEKRMQSINRYFKGEYSWRYTVGMECNSYSLALDRKDVELLRPLVIR